MPPPGERKSIPRSSNARNLIPGTAVGISPKRGTGKRENTRYAQAACPNFAGHVAAPSARAGGKGKMYANAHSCKDKDIVLFSHMGERGRSRTDVFRSCNARDLVHGTAVGISPKRGTGKRENSSCAQAACPNSADRAVARLARAGGKGNTHVNAHSCKDIVLFSHTDERGKSRADVFRSNNARNFIPGTAVGIFPKRGAGKRENANCAQEAYPNFAGHVAAVSVHRAIKERRIQRFPYPPRMGDKGKAGEGLELCRRRVCTPVQPPRRRISEGVQP